MVQPAWARHSVPTRTGRPPPRGAHRNFVRTAWERAYGLCPRWLRRYTEKRTAMDLDTFTAGIRHAFPVGTVIDNPGGGTSRIVGFTETHVSYKRGRSTISVAFADLHAAYFRFKGKEVLSTDLRRFLPSVFDSAARPAGHSCNCTFLFRLLEALQLSGPMGGSGVRGNPYSVKVAP